LCGEPRGLTIKGLVMGCHWHSGHITGHDDGITLVRFVYCIGGEYLQNRVVFRTTTYIKT